MRKEYPWPTLAKICVSVNWLLALWWCFFSRLNLTAVGDLLFIFAPSLFLTLAWRAGRNDPVSLKILALAAGLVALLGLIAEAWLRAGQTPEAWGVLSLNQFALSFLAMIEVNKRAKPVAGPPAEEAGETAEEKSRHREIPRSIEEKNLRRQVLRLIKINLGLMSLGMLSYASSILSYYSFSPPSGALLIPYVFVLGFTWLIWRRKDLRPLDFHCLGFIQVWALVFLFFAPLNSKLWSQVAVSGLGLLLIPLARSFAARRPCSEAEPSSGPRPVFQHDRLNGPISVALALLASTVVLGALYLGTHKTIRPIPYTGPLETARIGRLELGLPPALLEHDRPPFIITTIHWPEGDIRLREYAHSSDSPDTRRKAENLDEGLRRMGRPSTFRDVSGDFPYPAYLVAFTASADDIFQVTFGDLSKRRAAAGREPLPSFEIPEIPEFPEFSNVFKTPEPHLTLFMELPEGYLEFEYTGRRWRAAKNQPGPEMPAPEREAWFLDRSRELFSSYRWTDQPLGPGERGAQTRHGVLEPGPEATFEVHSGAMLSSRPFSFWITIDGAPGRANAPFRPAPTLRFTRDGIFNGEQTWTAKTPSREPDGRPVGLDGIPGRETVYLYRRPLLSAAQKKDNSFQAVWSSSATKAGSSFGSLLELRFISRSTPDMTEAERLGLWRAILASVRWRDDESTAARIENER